MGAAISECGMHRYKLWRIWDDSKPKVLFIMHNPSIADDLEDDPTIRRCVGFAKSWGYGGIYVGNLFSFRSTNPKGLLNKSREEIAPVKNLIYQREMILECNMHVLAYGNPAIKLLPEKLYFTIRGWHYLKLTKNGNPGHPLFLKSDLKPKLL